MNNTLRWGIIGTGSIARKCAEAFPEVDGAELAGVASRARHTADRFGEEFGIPRRYASYQALADDREIDIVYIATPHPFHCENTLMCLEAGKHVLCEKPFAINAAEAEQMINCARRHNRFLMEAMWTRFIPAVVEIRAEIERGTIGEARMFFGNFGFRTAFDPASRLFDPALGGGALLDIGVYPISFASMLFGEPAGVTGLAQPGKTGIDEQAGIVIKYAKGEVALLSCAVSTDLPDDARICGTEGNIYIPERCWRPTRYSIKQEGKEESREIPIKGNGYNYQIDEVQRRVRAGEIESAILPLEETLTIMRTMDELRRQWGVAYPGEGR